jgi:ubiquinone/menaquinone biosynthesis C-methylase UbiE
MKYWKSRSKVNGRLHNHHYQEAFTDGFGLSLDFYQNKKMLDIGCGPRGSLEWANMAEQRVGLDPLVEQYRDLGIDEHKTQYVCAGSEKMPFEDGAFDVVSSLNSLDHVDDLEAVIQEIVRALAPGGHFLLMVEVNHKPTVCEPQSFLLDIIDKFQPPLKLMSSRQLLASSKGMYEASKKNIPFNPEIHRDQKGVLIAYFVNPG